ncbi:MAG: hypothetical protein EA374_00515, partial [Acholeplasmatales bacterium]
MKKLLIVLLLITGSFGLFACDDSTDTSLFDFRFTKTPGDTMFDFDGNYTPPELVIDGRDDDEQWQLASPAIVYGHDNRVTVRFYRGETALFVFWDVQDENLLTRGFNDGDDVNRGDSVELYIDVRNDGTSRPNEDDVQINIGVHGYTRILRGMGGSWGSWNGLLDYAIHIDGVINDPDVSDNGYTVELMIPYAQLGMERDDDIGIALGHVNKVDIGNTPGVDYEWYGWVHQGTFVDPQNPSTYVVFRGNAFYARDDVPKDPIAVTGTVTNQDGEPVVEALVSLVEAGRQTTTDATGLYHFAEVDPNESVTLRVEKTDHITYETVLQRQVLRAATEVFTRNVQLIDTTISAQSTFVGTIENVLEGKLEGVRIEIAGQETFTDANGQFSLTAYLGTELTVMVSKSEYHTVSYPIDLGIIIVAGTTDLGTLSLPNVPSQLFYFGGQRGITGFDTIVYRELEGFRFIFEADRTFPLSAHIELFVDVGASFAGRDQTNYRLDFRANGTINIIHFGGGTNTDVQASGITLDVSHAAEGAWVSAFVPYDFLGVEP